MNRISVAVIVEGHGDVESVPILIRRIAEECIPEAIVEIAPAIRVPRHRIVKAGELENAVEFAARRVRRPGGVVVVLDSDRDVPCELGPCLFRRASAAREDIRSVIVLACQEYEAWFLAAATSIAGKRGLPSDLQGPADPEAVRDAKGWLDRVKVQGYSETLDQPALTALFDMNAAKRAASFARAYERVSELLRKLGSDGDL